MELYDEIRQKMRELSTSIRLLRKNGTALAQAERDYKILLRQKALLMRERGDAVTLIQTVIYGEPEVAELRFKRDVAKAMYDANIEHINVTKLELRILESQLSREWSNIGREEVM